MESTALRAPTRLFSAFVRRSIPPFQAGAAPTERLPPGETGVLGPKLPPSICLCTDEAPPLPMVPPAASEHDDP